MNFRRLYARLGLFPDIPLDLLQLMMSVSGNGQSSDQVVQERDNRLSISTEWKEHRVDKYKMGDLE